MKRLLKGAGLTLGGVALSALVLFTVANVKASSRLGQKFETHRIGLPLPEASDTAAIARGEHLAVARYGCTACHGGNLAGGVMIDSPPIGSIFGPNLTPGKGSRTVSYTMADWDRIVRHGIKLDGSPAVMPADDFFKMSDAELSDIVAYVRAAPPVDAEVKTPKFGLVGTFLVGFGKFPISAEHQPAAEHASEPPATANTLQFGEHLVATCITCHRSNLAGGRMPFGPPDWPAAANLTPHATGLGDWSYDDFERALTTGVSKDGRKLREPMTAVVPAAKAMLPTERQAIWTYLRSLAPTASNP
jgi:mono/diheme cytochrome c family protein